MKLCSVGRLIVSALFTTLVLGCSGPSTTPPSTSAPATVPAAVPTATVQLTLDELRFPGLQHTPLVPQMVIYSGIDALDFPSRCAQLRAARPAELAAPWQEVLDEVVLEDCSEQRAEGDPEGVAWVTYQASAAFKPGSATLQGLPIVAVQNEISELHARYSYVLDVPLQTALATLRPHIERHCQPMLDNPAVDTDCVMRQQEDGIWSVSVGELNSYNTLQRDPQNPGRSLYSEGGGD